MSTPDPEFELTIPDLSELAEHLCFESGPMVPMPVDKGAWRQAVLSSRNGAVTVHESSTHRTAAGWPVAIVRSDVLLPSGDVERRLHALFGIDRYCGVVLVRGPVDEHRAALEDMFRAVGVRHRPRVVAVAQVWAGLTS